MEVVYPCRGGLDVHKKSITACVLWAEAKGRSRKEKRSFATFTRDLLWLADWLQECGITHVAMESTGVYGKPVWNILNRWLSDDPLDNEEIYRLVRFLEDQRKKMGEPPLVHFLKPKNSRKKAWS